MCVTRAEAELMTTDHSFGSAQGSQAILTTWVSVITLWLLPQLQGHKCSSFIHSQLSLLNINTDCAAAKPARCSAHTNEQACIQKQAQIWSCPH